jgi:hypothetical protein
VAGTTQAATFETTQAATFETMRAEPAGKRRAPVCDTTRAEAAGAKAGAERSAAGWTPPPVRASALSRARRSGA